MTVKKRGRRAADTKVKTPLTEITEALSANSGALGKRAAVAAAAGGLVIAAVAPTEFGDGEANAEATAQAPEGDAPETTSQAGFTVDAVDSKAPVAGAAVASPVTATKAPEAPVEAPAAGDGAADGAAQQNSNSTSNGNSSSNSTGTSASESRSSSSSKGSKKSSGGSKNVSVPDGPKAQQVLAIAKQYVGTPYVSGGSSPSGWDCSGFTSYVYGKVGVKLPRTSGAQRGAGKTVSRSQAKPGDIIWSPGHVGIYAGNGMMYDAGNPRVKTSYRSIDWMTKQGAQFIRVL
ncbi:glycoside hydrolase [Brevibacterium ravenspurgense]|uniref:Glycoside hydrolase n=1 Tax=Brevibacterium ravenspurgense TaxID=479117 RepID=A0A2I1IEG4_9MICO|nr:C40 family peptidase [Brevibacterium ravenspurgense]PKY69511.1 glycoside hydrolase [Brevibacterium ravenspurgense]